MDIYQQIEAILAGKTHDLNPLTCITCHAKANTLNNIHDLIEDSGVPIQTVLDKIDAKWNRRHDSSPAQNKHIILSRGRLKLNRDIHQCISVQSVVETLRETL